MNEPGKETLAELQKIEFEKNFKPGWALHVIRGRKTQDQPTETELLEYWQAAASRHGNDEEWVREKMAS